MKPFEALKQFLLPIFDRLGLPQDWILSPDFWALVHALSGALLIALFTGLYKLATWYLHRRKQKFLRRNLNPWFSDEEIDKATRHYIPTYYQNVSPALDEEPGRFHIASASNALIPLFLKKFHKTGAQNKFFLILADAGMGKTTFMINLYLRYRKMWMPWRPKYQITLIPLGHPEALDELDKIDDETKKDCILLLDAFDEDTKALGDYKKRMSEILNKAWRFRAVVITCRTHFFPSEKEQPYLTQQYQFSGDGGEYTFQHLYVSVFSDSDVLRYLLKRFNVFNPFHWRKLKRAWELTRKSQNLIVRPMLLSHISDLVDEKREYTYSYQVYEALIEAWVKRESKKQGIREKYGSLDAFREKILQFSQELAVDMYQNQQERGGLFIPNNQPFFSKGGFSLTDLEEDWSKDVKESELRSRALLNRNAENYKFAHKSILEYFLAKEAVEREGFCQQLSLNGLDSCAVFARQRTIAALIQKADGYCFTATLKKPKPITQLTEKDIQEGLLELIVVKNAESIGVHSLRFLLMAGLDQSYFILSDHLGHKLFLWGIYYENETIAWIERLERSIDLKELLHYLKGGAQFKRRKLLELQKVYEHLELKEQLKILAIKPIREEFRDFLIQIESQEISDLLPINTFIKSCKALEKALPNATIIY